MVHIGGTLDAMKFAGEKSTRDRWRMPEGMVGRVLTTGKLDDY